MDRGKLDFYEFLARSLRRRARLAGVPRPLSGALRLLFLSDHRQPQPHRRAIASTTAIAAHPRSPRVAQSPRAFLELHRLCALSRTSSFRSQKSDVILSEAKDLSVRPITNPSVPLICLIGHPCTFNTFPDRVKQRFHSPASLSASNSFSFSLDVTCSRPVLRSRRHPPMFPPR